MERDLRAEGWGPEDCYPETAEGLMSDVDDDCYGDDEFDCCICGGDGWIENPDPMWYGFDVDEIPCDSCGGSGLRKDQTYW